MKLISCPIAYSSAAFSLATQLPRGSVSPRLQTESSLRVFRYRFCHVTGSCIITEETEVDLDLSRFSHCRTAKMRRILILAQTTREAPWHWRNVRDFMSLNFHRIFRFAWSIQNLGFMRSCTLNELILTSFNPLSFTKLLCRPGLVFTKPLPQLIFRAVSRTIEGLETVPQSSHRRPSRQHGSKRHIFRHRTHWHRESFGERRKQCSGST